MNLTVAALIESAAIISQDAEVGLAVETMKSQNCDRVYVTNEQGRITSVLYDYRLLKAHIRGDLGHRCIQQLTAPLNDTLYPSQLLEQAAVFFRSGLITELPVFEAHQFLGVVRRTNLLEALLQNPVKMRFSTTSETNQQPPLGSSLNNMLDEKSLKFG